MNVQVSSKCKDLGNILDKMFEADNNLNKALSGASLKIGPASEAEYGVDSAAAEPLFIGAGDSAWIGDKQIDAVTEALLKTNPEQVSVMPSHVPGTNKWNIAFKKTVGMLGDALDPIAGQLFSPWNISYLSKVFKEPLAYSNVDKLVRYESGGNPWAEIFTLFMEQYSGWGTVGQSGSLQNIMTNDVNVKDGMMSAPVINLTGTYSLTLEERTNRERGPIGTSPMARKQSYLNYVINMMKAIIAIYGNDETNTVGLLGVNPIQVWTGTPLHTLFSDTTVTTKGNRAYTQLAAVINDFLTSSDNKFQKIKIAMSPQAYNDLTSMTYSDGFDPTSAMKIFMKNYDAGTGENGQEPTIEFISEPLLKAGSIFNPSDADYMIIDAPEVGAGPENEKQPTVIFGAPLQQWVYPAVPGTYNTQYKTLARLAGILAPVPSAIRVYQGFGVQ